MKTAKPALFLGVSLTLLVGVTTHAQRAPDLAGIWSSTLTVGEDEIWEIADYACFMGCPSPTYEHLRALLEDPANDTRSFEELMVEAWNYGGERLVEIMTPRGLALWDELGPVDLDKQRCEPFGFVPQILSPLPVEISQLDDRILIRYEVWNVVRTAYLDDRDPPPESALTRHGYSVAHYEGSVLVIETTRIAPARLNVEFGGGGHSQQLKAIERYSRNGDLLRLELTLEDQNMLNEPLVYEKVFKHTPDVTFLEYSCETVTGQR